nr:MAG TPA: protein of unknown function (DUF5556) [Caudoviricetes sp.]
MVVFIDVSSLFVCGGCYLMAWDFSFPLPYLD